MNKASGGDGIPVELFQTLKRWCCESAALNMPANLENSAVVTGLEKVSSHSNPKGQWQKMFKLLHNCTQFTCYQCNAQNPLVRLQQYVNWELPDVKAGFRKAEEPEIEMPTSNICWIIKKAREFQKNIYCFIDYAKAFDYVDHNKLWKILKEMGIPDHLTCLLRNLVCRSGSNS